MSEKRQHLVETAVRLFGQYGFHGTGIDRIAAVADVSKKTMYHHFRSKDELILAALKHHDSLFRNNFMKAVDQCADDADGRLLGVFDVAHAWFADDSFYGCMFINAVGEYSEPNTAIREVCKEFKRLMVSYFEELAVAAQIEDPEALAASLGILLEGSIVTAQVSGTPDAAETAKSVARLLIKDAARSNAA